MTEEHKPLIIACDSVHMANEFEKERGHEYRMSEQLSRVEGKYVFIKRQRPVK